MNHSVKELVNTDFHSRTQRFDLCKCSLVFLVDLYRTKYRVHFCVLYYYAIRLPWLISLAVSMLKND